MPPGFKMLAEDTFRMDEPLDTIEYLARSDHRVEVLEAISREPRTREEIRELTDASRVTAGRIIADLEERGWIGRNGQRYAATSSGQFLAAEVTRLLENLETFGSLPPVVEWFPGDEPDFDLHLLDDATVVTADEGDLIAPIRRALELIAGADHLRAVGNGASSEFIEAIRDAVADGQTTTLVGPPEMVEALQADPAIREDMRAILDSDQASLLSYDASHELPVIQIADSTVALCDGDHREMVETDELAVYDWATTYFSRLQSDATPVPAETFAEDVPETATVTEDEAFVE